MKRSVWIGAAVVVLVLSGTVVLAPRAAENYYRGQLRAKLARIASAGDEVSLARYQQPPIPEDQNRGKQILLLAQPFRTMPQDLVDIRSRLDEVEPPEGTPPLTATDRQRLAHFLKQNLPTDDAFRAAADLTQTSWGHPHNFASTDISHLNPLRALANALAADAHFAARENDSDRFVRRVQQLHTVADVAGSDAVMIGALVQIGIDALAAHVVLDNPVTLSDEQTQLLIASLHDDTLRTRRVRTAIEIERAAIADLVINPAGAGGQFAGVMRVVLFRDAPAAIDSITLTRDSLGATSAAEADRLIDQAAASAKGSKFIPVIHHTTLIPTVFRSRTDRRLAAVALAIRAFTARKGRLPRDLGELVPTYLESIPVDPLDAADAPLRTTAGLTVVYSVGRDRADSQGDITPQPASFGSSPNPWTALDRGFSTSPSTQPGPTR